MAEVLAYLAIAAGPVAFVLARIVVGLGYRASRAPELAVNSNPLHVIRGQHPAILAALMGHPDCGNGSAWGERQLFDCALATLMDLSARGALRLRAASPSCQSEGMPSGAQAFDASAFRPPRRSSSYAPYASLVLECAGLVHGGSRCKAKPVPDPLDSLAVEALLPEEGARPGSHAVCASDLLTRIDKHWGEVVERLAPFRTELARRLWQEGYLEASFKQAAILVRWPFRLTMLWLLAGLVALMAGLVERDGPAVLIWAVLLVAVLTARVTVQAGPRLTEKGLKVARAAFALRDTVATGALDEQARCEGADSSEAAALRHASSWSSNAVKGGFLTVRVVPDAWRLALELAVCGGDMRSADGPQGFAQACSELDSFAWSAPEQMRRRDDFRALAGWCVCGGPAAFSAFGASDGSDMPGPSPVTAPGMSDASGCAPLAVSMHHIALMKCGEFSS
ncbi:hypothetical protein [Enorma phocaeensis]|uniref:hypothetical protein n=1 Tax=Enorma phocaeensis TaxID=1871019 RepID=UPI00320847A5